MDRRHWRWQGWPTAGEARATESVVQLLRGAALAWVLLQVAIELGGGPTGAQTVRGAAAAAAAGGIAAMAWFRRRTTTRRGAILLTVGGFAFDAVLLLGSLAAADVAGERLPWEALLLLVALGGVRLQVPGAAAAWLLSAVAMVALPGMAGAPLLPPSELVYRIGLAALMGLLFGLLSASHRDARRDATDHLEELQRIDEWRSRLLAVLAHDLRSPQAIEIELAETLHEHDQDLDAEGRRQLSARIADQGHRAERLLEDMLTMAQSDHAEITLDPELVELAPTIKDAVDSTGVDATIDVTTGLQARVDPARWRQVLVNLLGNAERHGAPPVAVTGRAADDGCVRVAVSDHGPGVPPSDQPNLFEAFEHGGHSDSIGLGLWIVHAIVDAHGGTVRYHDTQPHGATFEILLPRSAA